MSEGKEITSSRINLACPESDGPLPHYTCTYLPMGAETQRKRSQTETLLVSHERIKPLDRKARRTRALLRKLDGGLEKRNVDVERAKSNHTLKLS